MTSKMRATLVTNFRPAFLALALCFAHATAMAQVPVAPVAEKPGDKKLDISDLESKYWAPKDTDFSVVQNRTYPKERKFFISPQFGFLVNDQFSEGTAFGLSANYFFSERYGIQLSGLTTDLELNKANKDLARLSQEAGAQANHGELVSTYSVGFNWVPFYAKMSVLGKRIVYFDMAFTPTIGLSQYDQVVETGNKRQQALTYGFDVSQYFLFSKWIAARVDLKNQWRNEDVVQFRGNGVNTITGAKVSSKTTHDTLFMLGLMFFW